jgi:acetyl esterase/lipase
MDPNIPAPPYDPELNQTLQTLKFPVTITPELIPTIRARLAPTLESLLSPHPSITNTDLSIPGPLGPITLSIFRSSTPTSPNKPSPCILWLHGGGFFSGHHYTGIPFLLPFTHSHNAIIATASYHLAPEHPYPAALNDICTVLLYLSNNSTSLGINTDKIILAGSSAGAGLAAGVALYVRDKNRDGDGDGNGVKIKIKGLMLQAPMLDDRLTSISSHQYLSSGTFSRGSAITGWDAYLGASKRGGEDVDIYAAPGRAKDLSNLPNTFVEVGSAEVFRDESLAFVGDIWKVGGRAEIHVWEGCFHRWQAFVKEARVSKEADGVRGRWFAKMLED